MNSQLDHIEPPAEMPERNTPDYLGDGVYVACDGFQILLWTDYPNRIALDPEVYRKLAAYAKRFGNYFTGV